MSGYVPCACRDCMMDVAISGDTSELTLCLLCKDAGCDICPDPENCATHRHNCAHTDAYTDNDKDLDRS